MNRIALTLAFLGVVALAFWAIAAADHRQAQKREREERRRRALEKASKGLRK